MQPNLFDTPKPDAKLPDVKIEESWKRVLADEFTKPYFEELKTFLKKEMASGQKVFPPSSQIFSAFDQCPFDRVKVVILGQDPYHGPNQAHGMCFSVSKQVPTPPSLQNIYKELHTDLGLPIPHHGNLEKWAHQGVLLLNATLTVRASQPMSHAGKGWEEFTDAAIQKVSELKSGVVFILWGRHAQAKRKLIDEKKHFILEAAHPSPFSANNGFFGCRHFSKTNEILKKAGQASIDWQVE